MNPNEMSLDQCRKWLYRDIGLTKLTSPQTMEWAAQHWDDEFFERCWTYSWMFPEVAINTLDLIAAAMPEGWTWERTYQMDEDGSQYAEWCAWKHPTEIHMEDTGDEKLDRARLAVACRMAERGSR